MKEKSNLIFGILLGILSIILCLMAVVYVQTRKDMTEEIAVFALYKDGQVPIKKSQEDFENKENPIEEISETMLLTDNPMPWYIRVNLEAQVVNIYTKDSEGRYTVPYKAMLCSTGIDTPKEGIYALPESHENPVKARWRYLQGDVWGQYVTRIVDSILFHSVPYEDKSESTLEWWEYDRLRRRSISWLYSLNCRRCKMDL